MVTDEGSSYTSPAGKEFTFAAARFAAINPASRVLDMGCGYGDGACSLAAEFRCQVTAVDIDKENIKAGRELAVSRSVSHLATFVCADIRSCDYTEEPFDLVLAEGGTLSFIGRERGLQLAESWLRPRGYVAFSDLVFLSEHAPDEVREIFEYDRYHYESENSYRAMAERSGFAVSFMSLVPPSGWDNYYAHMARRLDENRGFFADPNVKIAFHREIDVYYRLEGFRYLGYLFCMARKKDSAETSL